MPKFLWELHTKSLFFTKLISKIQLRWQIEHWIAVQNAVIKLGPLSHSRDCTEFYNASPGPWGPGLCGDCHTIARLAGAGTWRGLYRKCVPGRPGLWATLAGTKAGMSHWQNVHSRLCPRYSRDPQGREYSWYVHNDWSHHIVIYHLQQECTNKHMICSIYKPIKVHDFRITTVAIACYNLTELRITSDSLSEKGGKKQNVFWVIKPNNRLKIT